MRSYILEKPRLQSPLGNMVKPRQIVENTKNNAHPRSFKFESFPKKTFFFGAKVC